MKNFTYAIFPFIRVEILPILGYSQIPIEWMKTVFSDPLSINMGDDFNM